MANDTPRVKPSFLLVIAAIKLRAEGQDLLAWQHLNAALRYGHNDFALTERARLMADMGYDQLAEMDWERARRRTPGLPPWRTVLTLWRYLDRPRDRRSQ